MARQLVYTADAVDLIEPRNDRERRVLELAVKFGLLSPMAWDTPPTHFGRNPATFAEICGFADEIAAGVLGTLNTEEKKHG
jgi:hypothetical protein